MRRLILIDGTNFFFKGSFAGNLTVNGKSVKYIYAFFRNIISLIKIFENDCDEAVFICCWDSGHDERTRLSEEAVKNGLIPKAYKQERRESRQVVTEEEKKEREDFLNQLKEIQYIFKYTKIRQAKIIGEEADDIVGSFVFSQKNNFDEIILISSDRDYYQLLEDKVKIYNTNKKIFITKDFLKSEYGLSDNNQWVDVGALAGELGPSSDTIYGVPGLGYISASKLISQYGNIEKLINFCKELFSKEIEKYGGVKKLKEAFEKGEFKVKDHRRELFIIFYEEIINLAYKLKKIRTWLDVSIPENSSNWKIIDSYIHQNKFRISSDDFDRLILEKKQNNISLIQDELF